MLSFYIYTISKAQISKRNKIAYQTIAQVLESVVLTLYLLE